jgi:16S rRNA (guanine527-N7)-methyltransferase
MAALCALIGALSDARSGAPEYFTGSDAAPVTAPQRFDPGTVAAVAGAALGRPVTPEQATALTHFFDELLRWNATHNLTAIRDPAEVLAQHLADCLVIAPAIERHLGTHPPAGPKPRLLDVGSGGGLPGALLAIVMPQLDVTCLDAVAKKAAFVRHVAGELVLPNLHAVHARAESHRPAQPYDLIAARALATLAEIVAMTRQAIAPGGAWLAMKGRAPDDEVAALPPDAEVFHVKRLSVPGLDAQRCIVWMRPHRRG